jgi:hypothetical protein
VAIRSAARVALLGSLACSGLALLVVAACNGTGTTPVCTFPDGADDPEAGCGEIIPLDGASEGSAQPDANPADTSTHDASPADASDAGPADAADSSSANDAADAHDAADTGAVDAGAKG